MAVRDLLGGLIRLHILHHAAHEPIFGLGIIEELALHGYKLSPGTLYPLLHGLEKSGYINSSIERVAGRRRRVYLVTEEGRQALALAKTKVWELFRELFEVELSFSVAGKVGPQDHIVGDDGLSKKTDAKLDRKHTHKRSIKKAKS
ncbi:MAG: PadR family transcriptional regulator [Thiobacillus sp.]|nr:PadR family transcriptional regulator [Thiobacillus sp.]